MVQNSTRIYSPMELEYELIQLYRAQSDKKDPKGTLWRERVLRQTSTTHQANDGQIADAFDIEQMLAQSPITLPATNDKEGRKRLQRLVSIAEGFSTVEYLLPDYVNQIQSLTHSNLGLVMFLLGIWANEEARHSLFLSRWAEAIRIAELTTQAIDLEDAQREAIYHTLELYHKCAKANWDPVKANAHFALPVYGVAYTALQEKFTAYAYRFLGMLAELLGQTVLAQICKRLVAEETDHHKFYLDVGRIYLRYDPDQYRELLYAAYREFSMPGRYADVPDYTKWTLHAMHEGVVPDHRILDWLEDRLQTGKSPLLSPQKAAEEDRQLDCWETTMLGIADIFPQLGLDLPTELRDMLRRANAINQARPALFQRVARRQRLFA